MKKRIMKGTMRDFGLLAVALAFMSLAACSCAPPEKISEAEPQISPLSECAGSGITCGMVGGVDGSAPYRATFVCSTPDGRSVMADFDPDGRFIFGDGVNGGVVTVDPETGCISGRVEVPLESDYCIEEFLRSGLCPVADD